MCKVYFWYDRKFFSVTDAFESLRKGGTMRGEGET